MATLRKGLCYREVKRAYTRKSKFKKKGFIKAVPQSKIVRYEMGDPKRQFSSKVALVSKDTMQIRHNSIESVRLLVNRILQNKFGKNDYFMQINLYPHHVLRENKMISGAGADRLSQGMSHAFGRPVGLAAQVKKGKTLITVNVDKDKTEIARQALKKASPKLPCKCSITVS